MAENIKGKVKHLYDTAANLTSDNPTLLAGEIGIESDTNLMKIGDGSSDWNSLTTTTIFDSITVTGTLTGSDANFSGSIKADYFLTRKVTISATTPDLDVSGVGMVFCDTTSGDIAIDSFTGGVIGQTIQIIKQSGANNLFFGHQTTGTQKLAMTTGANETSASYCNRTATYNGSWFVSK